MDIVGEIRAAERQADTIAEEGRRQAAQMLREAGAGVRVAAEQAQADGARAAEKESALAEAQAAARQKELQAENDRLCQTIRQQAEGRMAQASAYIVEQILQ